VKAEFLLIYPVEVAVDHGPAPIAGQPGDFAGSEVLDVQIVFPNESHPVPGRVELRVHQRGRLGWTAEPGQLAAGTVQDPVVSPGIEAPHRLGIGEHEQTPLVRRPGILLDLERRGRAGRGQLACRDKHVAPAGFRIVADDVLTAGIGGALQRGVGRPVTQPSGRSESLRAKVRPAENPLDTERSRIGLLGRCRGDEERQGEQESLGTSHDGISAVRGNEVVMGNIRMPAELRLPGPIPQP
jgi:hypothetical protein